MEIWKLRNVKNANAFITIWALTSSNTSKKKPPHPNKCLANEQTAHTYIMFLTSPMSLFRMCEKKTTTTTTESNQERGVLLKHSSVPQSKKGKKKKKTQSSVAILYSKCLTSIYSHIQITKLVTFLTRRTRAAKEQVLRVTSRIKCVKWISFENKTHLSFC